jgi:hypothetical protein
MPSKAVSIIRLGETKHSRQEKPIIKSVCTVYGTGTQHENLNFGGWKSKLQICLGSQYYVTILTNLDKKKLFFSVRQVRENY